MNTQTVLFKTLALMGGIALSGGSLSPASAGPVKHGAKPAVHKGKASRSRSGSRGVPASFHGMERADLRISQAWLDETDHAELRTYAPISSAQAAEAGAWFPQAQEALVQEPFLAGLVVFHAAARTPWHGGKTREEYALDSDERALYARGDWTQYLASYRALAGRLGAEGVAYPGAPTLAFEPMLTYGSAPVLASGQAVYAGGAAGQVGMSGSIQVRDAVSTPSLMQRALVASWATDRMAQAFLSPLHDMNTFHRDDKFDRAWKRGYGAAAEDQKRSETAPTSRQRGYYARKAAGAYHNASIYTYRAGL